MRKLTAKERREIGTQVRESQTAARMVTGLTHLAMEKIDRGEEIGPALKQLTSAIAAATAIASSLRKVRTRLKEIESGMVR